jgi:hypothetical protein
MNDSKLKSRALVFFGIYLLVAGCVGFVSNPSKAITALYSGGVFGVLSIGCGVLLNKGKLWAQYIGLGLVLMLIAVFSWRSVVGWKSVFSGNSEKFFASALISSMLFGAILTLITLTRRSRK